MNGISCKCRSVVMYIGCVILFLLYFLGQSCEGYFVTVDAHAEECFFEKVNQGTKLGLLFEISEGGFLDIDIKITGPDGKVIYQGDRETRGKYMVSAHMDGAYTYCFSNKMSTMTPKVVMFNIESTTAEEKPEHAGNEADHNKLEEMISQLANTLRSVKMEQEYMSVRDRIHRNINESTNSRVVTWAFFEALVLVIMVIGQVMYLKRFFEVRRVV